MGEQKAFTLIELMVTVAVAAILMAIALPSFVDLVRGVRASADVSALTTALSLARAEAVRHNSVACVTSGDWGAGWNVKVDDNGDSDCEDVGDIQARVFGAIAAGASLAVTSGGASAGSVNFDGAGARLGGGDFVLTYRSTEGVCTVRRDRNLTVGATGRTKIEECTP